MNTAYLLLGSNEGDRMGHLEQAIKMLQEKACPVIARSDVYETAAWGLTDQPDFLNIALKIETELPAEGLLAVIQQTEERSGRQRAVKWGQRTLDIDILFYNRNVINSTDLKIPHPYLQERRFALTPLNEIAPTFIHPVFNKTIAQLLEACPDTLEATKYAPGGDSDSHFPR